MARGIPRYVSKHRQYGLKTHTHIEGECKIEKNSSLRKLMRAARRGKLPEDRLFTISETQESADKRADKYLSAYRRRMNTLRKLIAT